jgi:MFS family permease
VAVKAPDVKASLHEADTPYAWTRLVVSLVLMTIGGSGMYGVTVVLPLIQSDFAVERATASLPYATTMIGFGLGGILMGRLADRYGVMTPVLIGAAGLGAGYILAGLAPSLWLFIAAQCLLIGFLGTSSGFAPLVSDISHWFTRRRGVAVSIVVSGNYLAGAVWPPIMQAAFDAYGWRSTYIAVGIFALIVVPPLAYVMRWRAPTTVRYENAAAHVHDGTPASLGLSSRALMVLLGIAGFACCVAMSMPQVHIVAYCGDLGYAAKHGAGMLSLMLAFGVLSRLVSGWLADRIGGLRTLLVNSVLQCVALFLFLPFTGLGALYVSSALFGLFQGGLIPAYAIIVREYFPARESGWRTGTVLMVTLFGMALGGWLAGEIHDLTGSYRSSFINAIAWNLVNMSIVLFLVFRSSRRLVYR